MIERVRRTVWVILLWTVVSVGFAAAQLSSGICAPLSGEELRACLAGGPDLIPLVVLAFLGAWAVGVVILLATPPGGAIRHFLVTVLVNSLAMMATLALLALVRLPSSTGQGAPTSIPLLVIGDDVLEVSLLIAIADALIRPVLLAVSGRWLLRTAGLAVLLVNAVLFWGVGELAGAAGFAWRTPEPRLLWILVASVVFTAIVTLLAAVLGLDRPRLDPATGTGAAWRLIDRLPPQRRNAIIENIRLREVYDTISRFGLEIAFGGGPFGPLRRLGDRLMGVTSDDLSRLSTPAKVRLMLQQLGPTFVKLGQMASSRADALPPEWREELDKLQNSVPPFPWERARAIIIHELGSEPERIFAAIDPQPLAAASLAQVHRATLQDGRPVVVKVQRPDVQAKVRADLGVIAQLAEVAESRLAMARRVGAVGLVQEFSEGVLQELDYSVEAYHARRLKDVLEDMEGVDVPATFPETSTGRVLTMEFVPGVKATRAEQLDPAIDRQTIARRFIRATIKQVLIEGFFHADPHPGNVMLDPVTGRLTFLDLGLIGELHQQQRFDLLALLWALRTRDAEAVARVARRLCLPTGPVDEAAFQAAVERLVHRHWIYGGSSFSAMMSALFATLGAHNLRMRQELTLAVKALTQSEELMRAIDPGLPLVQAAAEEAESLLRQQFTAQRVGRMVQGEIAQVVEQAMAHPATMQQLIPALLGAVTDHPIGGILSAGAAEGEPPGRDRLSDGGLTVLERSAHRLMVVIGLAGLCLALATAALALAIRGGEDAWDLEGPVALVLATGLLALGTLLWRWRSPGTTTDRDRA